MDDTRRVRNLFKISIGLYIFAALIPMAVGWISVSSGGPPPMGVMIIAALLGFVSMVFMVYFVWCVLNILLDVHQKVTLLSEGRTADGEPAAE